MNRWAKKWKRIRRIASGGFWRAPAEALPAAARLPAEPDEDRLRRLAQWCLDGRLAAAELELHGWQRQPDCPPQARVILAALLARRDRLDHALLAAHGAQNQDRDEDRALAKVLVAVLVASDLTDAARRVSHQLFHRHGHEPAVESWMRSVQVPGHEELPPVPDAAVERLAGELAAQPQVIPALVAAQRAQSRSTNLLLLRRALARAARDLSEPRLMLMVCQALTELALVAQDTDDARRWAHRGLKIDPYSAPLALLLTNISDDQAVGPTAGEVLTGAAEAHPDYPDLQAALIRRRLNDGRADEARWRLHRWMERQPDHPLAKALQQELAA